MEPNNPTLQEGFAEKMLRIQKEQQRTSNPEVVRYAFENVKKVIEKFVANSNNCFAHEITFGIREIKAGVLELYDQKEGTTIAMLSMSELTMLDEKICNSGLRTSGSFGDNGHLTVRWN